MTLATVGLEAFAGGAVSGAVAFWALWNAYLRGRTHGRRSAFSEGPEP